MPYKTIIYLNIILIILFEFYSETNAEIVGELHRRVPRSDTNQGKGFWHKTKKLFKTKEGKWSKTKIGAAGGLALLAGVLLNGNSNTVNTTGYPGMMHQGMMQPYCYYCM
uniref:Uncharacterized protein n=1 Tax=Meloidogyne floridensis TaxID=298350 RepID=A0A915PBU2_9BILA